MESPLQNIYAPVAVSDSVCLRSVTKPVQADCNRGGAAPDDREQRSGLSPSSLSPAAPRRAASRRALGCGERLGRKFSLGSLVESAAALVSGQLDFSAEACGN